MPKVADVFLLLLALALTALPVLWLFDLAEPPEILAAAGYWLGWFVVLVFLLGGRDESLE